MDGRTPLDVTKDPTYALNQMRFAIAAELKEDPESATMHELIEKTEEYDGGGRSAVYVLCRVAAACRRRRARASLRGKMGDMDDFCSFAFDATDAELDPQTKRDPGRWDNESETKRLVLSRQRCGRCKEFRVTSCTKLAATRADEGEKTVYTCLACGNSW